MARKKKSEELENTLPDITEEVVTPPEKKTHLGVGLDIGTMNIVAARKVGDDVVTKRIRDCFLDMDIEAKKMLKLSNVSYVEHDDTILILGDAAIHTANIFGKEVRRPLSQGLISASEIDALEILSILIENVLGKPSEPDEVCYFSVPAAPADNPSKDVVYHQAVFEKILRELGYDPVASNEAQALIFSECADTMFSAIGISMGSGMINCALSYNTMTALQFSLERSGDYIDGSAAKALGTTASKICAIKEKGVNLVDPSEGDTKHLREREAIATYYRSLISYALDNIANEFKKVQDTVDMPMAIPIVIGGGTSMATGLIQLFEEVFETKRKRFPIEISEIRHADDPMTSVAQGLLIQALQEYQD
jgi:hypothetical protein